MRKSLNFIIIIWILFFFSCTTSIDDIDTLQELNTIRLQGIIDSFIANTPGILGIVCQVDRSGYLPWGGATGFFDSSGNIELNKNNKFFIGSITKMFTAAMVFQMVEEGTIILDHPIIDYLSPDKAAVLKQILYGRDITVGQALNHRSGIFNYFDSETLGEQMLTDPSGIHSTLEILNIVLNDGKPDFQPGKDFHYSNTNYLLLGFLIENMDDTSYATALNGRILARLGLENTFLFFGSSVADREGTAHSYDTFDGQGKIYDIHEFTHSGWAWAAGGLISTTEDLNTFLKALTSGQLFENSSTFQQMRNLGNNSWYAHGIMIINNSVGGISYGHGGYFCGSRAVSYYYPDKNTVISTCFTFDGTQKNIDVDILLDQILAAIF